MGHLVRLADGVLERFEAGAWVDRGAFEPTELAQNNFGLVAGWRAPGPGQAEFDAATAAVLRDIPGESTHVIEPQGAKGLSVEKITDSGFVYGRYQGDDWRWRIFRHRAGQTVHHENPQGGLHRTPSDPGPSAGREPRG